METNNTKYIHYLDKVCSEYCMNGSEVYTILISQNDERFPLSYETIKYMVLKEVCLEKLKKIFTNTELKSIFNDINMKKIKSTETRNFVNSVRFK